MWNVEVLENSYYVLQLKTDWFITWQYFRIVSKKKLSPWVSLYVTLDHLCTASLR